MRHMKKLINVALSAIVAISLTGTAFAGLTETFTPDDVMTWLENGDNSAENAKQQAVNGLARVTEMLAYVTGINANEEQADALDNILAELKESLENEETTENQKMAVCAIEVFRTIEVMPGQTDPEGRIQEQVDALVESFSEGDESAEIVQGQVVNALYHSVRLLALITEGCSGSQEMIDQIEGALEQFAAEDEAAEDIEGQIANGAKWLFKMLGAFSRVQYADNIDALTELTESVEQQVEQNPAPQQAAVYWLYGTVQAAASLA